MLFFSGPSMAKIDVWAERESGPQLIVSLQILEVRPAKSQIKQTI